MIDGYISVDEAAKRLGKHAETIRRWCKDGFLEAVVPPTGRGYMVSEQSVRHALQPVPLRNRRND